MDSPRAAVIVLCEPERAASHGDKTRAAVCAWLRAQNFTPDDGTALDLVPAELSRAVESARERAELIVVCGGTGIGSRDIAPQTLKSLCDFEIPGIGEMLRAESLKFSLNSRLSRCAAYVSQGRLVLSIPGSAKASVEQLEILKDLLPHALEAVQGHCKSRRAPGIRGQG
ncbi:MAG TPA: molybdopterin-binding protein [Planctomycetota bacterium]|nr:molybdopterin-binding protein [Planctomycetota bacterium]